jgi:hypothetical protein
MNRSKKYPTHYRVGKWRNDDVYWSPAEGYAVDLDQKCLWGMHPEAVEEAELFTDPDDCEKLLDAVYESDWLLVNAMSGRMLSTVKAWLKESIKEASEAERAKREGRYGQ